MMITTMGQEFVMGRKKGDPLEPIATVVRLLLYVYSVSAVASIVLTLTGRASMFSWNSGSACVDAVHPAASITMSGLRPGATGGLLNVQLCTNHPSVGQHLLETLNQAPGYLLFIGVLALLWRLIRDAKLYGLYTARMAAQLRGIGWLLIIGGLAVMIIQGEAASYLAATMVNPAPAAGPPWSDLDYWRLPTVTLLTALGVLSFARIMRIGSVMREDLAGTV